MTNNQWPLMPKGGVRGAKPLTQEEVESVRWLLSATSEKVEVLPPERGGIEYWIPLGTRPEGKDRRPVRRGAATGLR